MRNWHYGTRLVYLSGRVIVCIIISGLLHAITFADTPVKMSYKQLATQAEMIPVMIKDKVLERSHIPDPHWHKDACLACHSSETEAGVSVLKADGDHTCYYCHSKEEHTVIHPVNLTVGKKMFSSMGADFRRHLSTGKKAGCLTCHNVLIQCKKKPGLGRMSNKLFLRGGYYSSRAGICYQCHDKKAYTKLNPHDQISDAGVLEKDKCLICHLDVPQQHAGAPSTNTRMRSDLNRAEICLNCHIWQPHPGGNMSMFSGGKPPNHLVVPNNAIRTRLSMMTKKSDLEMPLEPGTGRVYCATCHNPHERGVIRKASLAKGADEKKRLRSKRLCINCHEK